MGDEGEPPEERAKESIRDGVDSFRSAVGHLDEAYRNLKSNRPFSVRAVIILGSAYLVNLILNVSSSIVDRALTATTAYIAGLVPDQISVVSVILAIFYLQLVNMAMFLIAFNILAARLRGMEQSAAISDGGEEIEGGLAPKWLWFALVSVGVVLGGLLGSGFGQTGMIMGAAVGGLISDEIYRRADDGSLLGTAL